jgi:hypothetical protein
VTDNVHVNGSKPWHLKLFGVARQVDFLTLSGGIVALFLAPTGQPWWTLTGASTSRLFTIQVSPYYLDANAVGFSNPAFAGPLGSLTSVLLILLVFVLGASSFHRGAWWGEITKYFSLCVLCELYLSFLLMYHAAETGLLGMYGIVPPSSGTMHLPAVILGLDMNGYLRPLVTAGFSLPFYLGFLSIGLVGGSLILENQRTRKEESQRPRKGVDAIFTSD